MAEIDKESTETLARLDLPIRDVLRFAIPGAYAVVMLAIADHLLWSDSLAIAGSPIIIPLGFLFGLFGFVADFHSWTPPWRKHWKREMQRIAASIADITGRTELAAEEMARPAYKLWIEAVCAPSLRGYLHYKTGLYYTYVTVSAWSLAILAAVALSSVHVVRLWNAAHPGERFWSQYSDDRLLVHMGVGSFLLLMAVSCYLQAKKDLFAVTAEGRVTMNLPQSSEGLNELARAATKSERDESLDQLANRAGHEAITELLPALSDAFQSLTLDAVVQETNPRTGRSGRVAHLTLNVVPEFVPEINGLPNPYGGPRQKRLEFRLARQLTARLGVDAVRLQVSPIDRFWQDPYQQEAKTPARMTLEKAVQSGVVTEESPVYRCAKEYSVAEVLVLGRFVIGPSPGLAAALTHLLERLPKGCRILDPFSGTGLSARVAARVDPTATVTCLDRLLNGYDAFEESPRQAFDVLVVDPYYEDVLPYVALVAQRIQWTNMVVATGSSSDVGWSRAVVEHLKCLGTVDEPRIDTPGANFVFVRRK